MIDPTDQDIAEALRLAGYSDRPDRVAQVLEDPKSWKETLAHARTIASLRIATEALEEINAYGEAYCGDGEDWSMGYGDGLRSVGDMAQKAIDQIKEAGNG